MNDDELRERFAQLRAEERAAVPRFQVQPRTRPVFRRAIAVTAALVLIAIVAIIIRPRPTTFSDTDRAAVRSVAAWHPPTGFLLRTPGRELLTTTPRIPDLKGIPR